ncbi:MAG TPA: hypothetical protein VGN80_04565 [Devosiaceae bacterium]|nr:hypothetical protein [Devosiaceae bacterium]
MTDTASAADQSLPPTLSPAPIRWRLALLNFVAVYPLITMLIYVIFPLTDGWAIWQRTLLLAPIMIAAMVYGIAPRIQRHFGRFIAGRQRN